MLYAGDEESRYLILPSNTSARLHKNANLKMMKEASDEARAARRQALVDLGIEALPDGAVVVRSSPLANCSLIFNVGPPTPGMQLDVRKTVAQIMGSEPDTSCSVKACSLAAHSLSLSGCLITTAPRVRFITALRHDHQCAAPRSPMMQSPLHAWAG